MADGAGNITTPSNGKPPGIIARVAQAAQFVIAGVSSSTWMSPLQPLQPLAPPEAKGRQWDYPVGINLNYRPRATERVDFRRLRLLAENCGVARSVIQRKKELLEAFEWSIKPREDTPGKRPDDSAFKDAIDQITALFRTPDGVNDWAQWLHIILEEVLVVDALAIYRRPTADRSRLWGLEVISGDTIFPLTDQGGRRPQAPSPAYQQILKGVPAGDFTLDELIYYPRSPRAGRLYGQPPLQWVIGYIETFIERQKSQLAYFSEGNVVDAMLTGPENWTIQDIKTWQAYWDDQFSGNVEARRRGQWVPFGAKAEQLKQPPLKDEFDEWLARIVCYAFSESPQPFIKQVSRGNQESQQEVAEEGGIAPLMAFVKRVVDKVIAEDLQHPELEFSWSEDREFDPAIAAKMDDEAIRNGSASVNAVRDRRGDDPINEPWANESWVVVPGQGVVFMKDAYVLSQKMVETANEPPPPVVVQAAPGNGGAPPSSSGDGGGGAAPQKALPAPEPKPALKKSAPLVVPLANKVSVARERQVRGATKAVFAAMAADVKGQVQRKLLTMGKADDAATDAETVANSLNLSGLDALPETIEDALADVAEAGGRAAVVQLGVSDYKDLTNQVATRAAAWARTRAAELVGKRWTADGELIDNPNPKWAISESTRNFLRKDIADGLADNLDVAGIADKIAASYAFSDDRAQVIAHTEVRRANVQGSLEGARAARDVADLDIQKVWFGGQNPCEEICQPNIDQGAIDLDDDFESGDDGPPAHAGCFCSISWEIGDAAKMAKGVRRPFMAIAA